MLILSYKYQLKNLTRKYSLVIENLSHSYDNNKGTELILDSINLKIKDKELLGLLGPSGCGKTTLLRLIAGFEVPKEGKIILNNNEISSNNNIVVPEKRNIGMVFQDYALFPHLNVFDNAKFGLKNKNNLSRIDYLLNVLGINNLKNRYPHELSGGQKQRLAIARALAPGTSFLLLDEPFCSLDLNVKLRLRSELPTILRNFNACGLMVTHDPEEAMAICDKVAVMNNGYIHQIDEPSELINNPKTLFVSSFILGNNVLKINYTGGIINTVLGSINNINLQENLDIKYLSISPKSISIEKSLKGKGTVIAREYLGEYFIYKVLVEDIYIRVRTHLTNNIGIGEKCNLNLIKNMEYFLFPGGFKNKI